MKPATKAWFGLGSVSFAMAALLFAFAGTFRYWQAWLFLALTVGASLRQNWYLVTKDPALLDRRLRGGPGAEKERAQKIIMLWTSLGYLALMIVPALDRRHGWSSVPPLLSLGAGAAIVAGYALIYRVFKENTYAAATVEVAPGQTVISTGPYAVVRHPMYAGALLYLAATPLALGSYWGLLAFVFTLPAMVWRIFNEERLLKRDLPGYAAYCGKVRWRLVPGVF